MMNADRMIPKKAWHDKKVQLVSHVDNHHHHHHHQQQQHQHHHHHHHRHLSPTSSSAVRRSRADTMPSQSTAFPYLSSDPATIAALSKTSAAKDVPTRSSVAAAAAATSKQVVPPSSSSAATLRTRSGSVTLPPSLANPFGEGIFSNNWGREHVQSPTTPTTDQLLEGEGNTIASTLAQLGLDDERDKRHHHHTIHTRHSYSSLRSVANWHHPQRRSGHESIMDTPWGTTTTTTTTPATTTTTTSQAPPISESMVPFSAVAESPNIDPSLIMAKFQSQTGRPRAISMSVAGSCYAPPHQPPPGAANSSTDDLSSRNLLSPSYRSIWHPPVRHRYQQQHNPSRLRTSNSSADLLELMARQRTSIVTDDAHDDWVCIHTHYHLYHTLFVYSPCLFAVSF